ncbi:MAG: tRNA (adenosine(37)-N6)-dimethylallyltransferase MiaA [Opitutaceae bacterium]|jgi:tRNA dimethylallyltransferase
MSEDTGKVLHLLTGCTAAGKTELALSWAERNNAEIVSSDSLLFYRGMDIGTAKPSREELARVPHHLIDICSVAERMDITRYVELARSCAESIHARGGRVLVTGGSGFYLKAFFAPVADDIVVAAVLRERVASLSLESALAELRKLNPAGLGSLDTANPRRVTRALERCLASGKTLEGLAAEFAARPSAFSDWSLKLVQLDRRPDDLERRIAQRAQAMIEAGLVDEVRHLLTLGLAENPSAARAIGYRETIAVLQGSLPADRLLPEIVQNTKALVKKQRTWFKTQLPPHPVVDAASATVEQLFVLA